MAKKIIIVSTSGGKDSTATYLLALESGQEFVPVFADTGNEHELTYEYVSTIHKKTGGPKVKWVKADFKRQLSVRKKNLLSGNRSRSWDPNRRLQVGKNLRATGNPFLDLCKLKGRFPATRARFCSIELKTIPILLNVYDPYLSNGCVVESWQGVRALESKERSCLPIREQDPNTDGVEIFRPVIGWTATEIFDLHKRHGIEPNPLYSLGCKRVGCMPCIHASKAEILNIANRFPHHIDRIRKWESVVSECSRTKISTFFAADKTPGRGDTRSSIDRVVQWSKTLRGGRQYSIPEPLKQCASFYGLCE